MGRDVRDDRDDKCGVPRVRARVFTMWPKKCGKSVLARRLKSSSLSSLSSPEGSQGTENSREIKGRLPQKNVPVSLSIVPDVPVLFLGNQ